MRKRFLNVISICSLIFGALFLVSCNFESDNDIAIKNLEQLLNALDSQNKNQIKELFAHNISSSIGTFDDDLDELLNYYNGDYESQFSYGVGVTNDRDSGIETKWFNMSYDVTTTEDIYRIAIIWYVKDTSDSGNVGIWSLYILRFSEDAYPEMAYGGDGLWTNGIHVGVPNIGNQ